MAKYITLYKFTAQGIRDIKAKIEALGEDKGRPIGTKVFKPEEIYSEVKNIAPDLIVYFGDLAWRSAGSSIDAGTAMIAITTSNSTSVNADRWFMIALRIINMVAILSANAESL